MSPSPGGRPARSERPERRYFCRTCRRTQIGRDVPAGWYVLSRALGQAAPHLRLGAYCCLDCLLGAEDRLREGERASRDLAAAEPRERVQARAEQMITAGASIRVAAEKLALPLTTLRGWLHETGFEAPAEATKPAAMILNEMDQRGELAHTSYEDEWVDGDGFRVTVSAIHPNMGTVHATATAASKKAARAEAAAALVNHLREQTQQ